MNELIRQLTQNLSINEQLSTEEFSNVHSSITCKFPSDYLDFMMERNGGEGFINEAYVMLWRFDDLLEFNKMYMVDTFAPSLFFIGSDGGDTAYAIQKESGAFVDVPFIGMADDIAEIKGTSFVDFLVSLSVQ